MQFSGAGRWVCAAAVAIAVFGVGTWLDPGEPNADHYRGPTPATGLIEDAIGYSPARMERLIALRDGIVRDCAREHGLRWTPPAREPHEDLTPRGLFGIPTPGAVEIFLDTHGYGVADTIDVMRRSAEDFAAHQKAGGSQTDIVGICTARSREALGTVDPMTGGDLGRDYDRAIAAMIKSADFAGIESRVLACMHAAGVEVSSLDLAAEPFIRRLVDLVGGSAELDGNGRLVYEIGGEQPRRFRTADLASVRTDELETARTEARCRMRQGARVDRLWAAYSAPVLDDHQSEVESLRRALDRASQK